MSNQQGAGIWWIADNRSGIIWLGYSFLAQVVKFFRRISKIDHLFEGDSEIP